MHVLFPIVYPFFLVFVMVVVHRILDLASAGSWPITSSQFHMIVNSQFVARVLNKKKKRREIFATFRVYCVACVVIHDKYLCQ